MARTAATFKVDAVVRAVKAARAASLSVARTELRKDGTIILHHCGGETSACQQEATTLAKVGFDDAR